MNRATATADELRPRTPDRLSRGAVLAIVAHLGLLVALTLSVNWKASEPEGVEAELWAAVPQAAAPRAVEPPAPVVPPKPAPEPEPEPPKPAPKVEPPPPDRDAEIAQEKRLEKEKLEKQRLEDAQRAEKIENEKERAKERAAEEERREAEQKKNELEKKKAEAERKKKAEAERLAKVEAQRLENLKRITGQADASGAPGSVGNAAQSAGPSAGYAGRIKAKIRPNVVFADEIAGNPLAAVEVKVAPDGTIVGRRLVTSSGVASWDEAVLRAIDRTEVLPRNPDGPTPSSMLIEFRPRDF